jgi:hypothetical protein
VGCWWVARACSACWRWAVARASSRLRSRGAWSSWRRSRSRSARSSAVDIPWRLRLLGVDGQGLAASPGQGLSQLHIPVRLLPIWQVQLPGALGPRPRCRAAAPRPPGGGPGPGSRSAARPAQGRRRRRPGPAPAADRQDAGGGGWRRRGRPLPPAAARCTSSASTACRAPARVADRRSPGNPMASGMSRVPTNSTSAAAGPPAARSPTSAARLGHGRVQQRGRADDQVMPNDRQARRWPPRSREGHRWFDFVLATGRRRPGGCRGCRCTGR